MDQVLFDEIDLSEDREAMDRISETGRVLDSYYEEISRIGGISRNDAVALVNEYGVMIGERYPPQSFTEVASRTNLTVTLEAILERAGVLLMQLLKKAAELLLKIVNWIRDLLKNRIQRFDHAIRKAKALSAVKKASDDMSAAGVDTINSGAKTHVLENALKLALETYENNFNDLIADLVVEGPFSRAVRSIAFGALGILDPIQAKVQLLNTIVHRRQVQSTSADLSELGELRAISTPIYADRLKGILEASGIKVQGKGHGPVTVEDVMASLLSRYTAMRSTSSYEPADPDVVILHTSDGTHSITQPFFTKPEVIERATAELVEQLNKFRRIVPSESASPANREAYSQAVETLRSEISALRMLVVVAEGCSFAQNRLIDDLWNYNEAVIMLQRGKVNASGDPSLIEKVNRIQMELKEAIRRVGTK